MDTKLDFSQPEVFKKTVSLLLREERLNLPHNDYFSFKPSFMAVLTSLVQEGIFTQSPGAPVSVLKTNRCYAGGEKYLELPVWSSYQGCHSLTIVAEDAVRFTVYDGDMLTGEMTHLRYAWNLQGDLLVLLERYKPLANYIAKAWENYVKEVFELLEAKKRRDQLQELSETLFDAIP